MSSPTRLSVPYRHCDGVLASLSWKLNTFLFQPEEQLIGAAPPTADYANMVAISDMFEIETSKLVATKSQDAKVKSFATQMIRTTLRRRLS